MVAMSLPKPRLEDYENLTPFRVYQCDKMGPGRRLYDVLVVKGTLRLSEGVLELAPAQAPIELVDAYHDPVTPERSSVAHAGDAVVTKPTTDVIVTGHARPYGGRAREWDASVVVMRDGAMVSGSAARVTGPRRWEHRPLVGWRLSAPDPTEAVPVRYELAYGGYYPDPEHVPAPGEARRWVTFPPNPCGTGHWDERLLDRAQSYAGPQWERLDAPVSHLLAGTTPAGFGPLARWWQPRQRFAGTYGSDWLERARLDAEAGLPPDYAPDFDARFFQCAAPELIAPTYLQGDESIVLSGLRDDVERLVCRLPGVTVGADLLGPTGIWHEHTLPLDTVHIDLDASTVALTWRMSVFQGFGIGAAIIHSTEPT